MVIWWCQRKLILDLSLTKLEVTRMKAYSAFSQKFQYSLDFNSENCIFLETTGNGNKESAILSTMGFDPYFLAWTDLSNL